MRICHALRRAAVAFVALGPAACQDQAFVSYVGTVSEAEPNAPGSYSFDEEPPQGPPIQGAVVSLCEETKCTAMTNEGGEYGPVWQSFPLLTTRTVQLTVKAPDYETFVYSAAYPKSPDPRFGERLLNVKLRRTVAGGPPGPGPGEPDAGP